METHAASLRLCARGLRMLGGSAAAPLDQTDGQKGEGQTLNPILAAVLRTAEDYCFICHPRLSVH